jgi:hypothetical protein
MSETKIRYIVTYDNPRCFDDDDGPEHDQWWERDAEAAFSALSDAEARRIALGPQFARPEACYHGRTSRVTALRRVTETTECVWDDTVEIPLR